MGHYYTKVETNIHMLTVLLEEILLYVHFF